MREYQEETNRQLNFENLPVPPKGVSFPEYFTMMMELTRENQTQVSSKFLVYLSVRRARLPSFRIAMLENYT